jgi:S1-C subfamily serine protease
MISETASPGEAGGPVFDKNGDVVGFVRGVLNGTSGTVVVPVQYIRNILTVAGIK